MLRGLPHLAKYMPEPKDARRLIPDPENEPNFYAISKKYPLPNDPDLCKEEPDELSVKNLVPTAPATAGAPRLSSDVSWLQNQIPVAKRQAIQAPGANTLLNIAAATPALAAQALGRDLAQLQQVRQTNNQLLAAAALQTTLNQAQQNRAVTVGGNNNTNDKANTSDAPLVALLRSRTGFGRL